MSAAPLSIDSENDLAALVYASGPDPDRLLAPFIGELQAAGIDVVGLLQRKAAQISQKPEPIQLYLAAAQESRSPVRSLNEQLDEYALTLEAALDRRPDLLVLNRSGWREMNGGGLRAVLAKALTLNVPVLIAVPEALFQPWLSTIQGLAVRLGYGRESGKQHVEEYLNVKAVWIKTG